MLLNVHVKNLALIEDVDVCFDEGLNILSGETGAGKSIILGAIGIALGQKIPKDIIRTGAEYALAELVFFIDEPSTIMKLKLLGISIEDDGQVTISRRIMNNKSLIKVNGEVISASDLKEASAYLINIHGQHETEILLHRQKHLGILDEYGGEKISELSELTYKACMEYRRYHEELEKYDIDDDKRLREISLCEHEIEEIDNAALTVDEDVLLEEKTRFYANAQKIVKCMSEAYGLINSDGMEGMAGTVSKNVSDASQYDSSLSSIADTVADIENLCHDASREIEAYIDKMNYDEEEAYNNEKRMDLINLLKSKYGNTIEKIGEYREISAKRLYSLKNSEEEKKKLEKEMLEAYENYEKAADALSGMRKNASKEFETAIVSALMDLNLGDVKFSVMFTENIDISPNGKDNVEFYISTNTGENLRPLAEVASGGELSRIMLGLKSIMASKDGIDTMIFDEIDAGISGRTAQKVAEKLNTLSEVHQIICITHLPQIASMADNHYVIEKTVKNERTVTEINKLDYDSSIKELARMLGGTAITDSVLASAKEMKQLANNTKKH